MWLSERNESVLATITLAGKKLIGHNDIVCILVGCLYFLQQGTIMAPKHIFIYYSVDGFSRRLNLENKLKIWGELHN